MTLPDTQTIELLAAGTPRQLFILLHDQGASAADMLLLGQRLGDAFAEAAVLIPEGLTQVEALPALLAFVRAQQKRFGILQSDTALAGFGTGADVALALSDTHDGLVGRVLAFAAAYTAQPESFETAPALTTLHLLHGKNDRLVSASLAQAGFERLVDLGADATLDIAGSLGHELHPALMDQAVMRLQTCVPLRHWRAA